MIRLPPPALQSAFAGALGDLRGHFLRRALEATARGLDPAALARELETFAPAQDRALLAARGMAAELVFAVPLLLAANPRLLGYYRLLLGYSQKEFYRAEFGTSRLARMERDGSSSPQTLAALPDLCQALAASGSQLLGAIGETVTPGILDELILLTLGPQLRGGANVQKGTAGIGAVFEAIHEIVRPAVKRATDRQIDLTNAADRRVLIEFAPDPDIIILEEMLPGRFRKKVAIEVKAGSDFSNIHNRIGEAEKSHQKARAAGFNEFWTVVNVDRIDMAMARSESPTTNRFYRISDLQSRSGAEYEDFRTQVISLTGIRS